MPREEGLLPRVEGAVIRDEEHGYDARDLSLKAVGITMAVVVLLVILSALLLHPIFGYNSFRHHVLESPLLHAPSPPYDIDAKFPEPRLQPQPRQDLQSFRAAENHWLETYGWTDKSQGLVRVPIEKAMNLLLQRGLPTREERHAR